MTPFTNRFGQPVGNAVPNWRPPLRPNPTILEGRFCRIEPLYAEHHAEALWAAWQQPDPTLTDNDGEARWTYLGGRPFDDASGCHDWLASRATDSDPSFMTIIAADSGLPSGVAAWLNIVPEHGSLELGHLHFSPRLSRTPVSTEAFALLMRHAFALGYRRLEWKCDALNAPSRRAAERLGFQFEGIFRQHRVVQGHNRDTAWYAILDDDWPRLDSLFRRWLAPENFDAQGRQHVALSSLTSEE